jgi:hypothetical protein
MLMTFLGLPPPDKKQKVDFKLANKQYDANKRQRRVVPGWKTEFSKWIVILVIHDMVMVGAEESLAVLSV